ncbi:MMPL family transporter [Actinotalea sp. M2MS4P-6]|uniref:MMPL family transporter n=1 Tax=Actinotalea sp. M2MS4P-6 TaxID=2983762 RepID=UPI0021E49853|nr:MMPL family transporter [Actinotalea sp. M2MS4P-6]MCV2394562.1 MMPL family transporter [Actinotalea sp. M2MS4P-6]
MFDRLGAQIARHPKTVILVWLVLTLGCFAVTLTDVTGETLFDRLHTGAPGVPGSESAIANEIIDTETTTGPSLSLAVDGVDPADPALPDAMAAARTDLAAIDGVASVIDPYVVPDGPANPAVAGLLAQDGQGFLVVVELEHGLDATVEETALAAVEEQLAAIPGELSDAVGTTVTGQVGGETLIVKEITDQVEKDLQTGERIALPVALFVMVLVFGGLLSASMPLIGAIASIAGGLGSVLALSYWLEMDASVVNVVTILGLGLSIDYGLLIVSRYREELHALVDDDGGRAVRRRRGDGAVQRAMRTTMHTAGRTVTFSALTVAIAISGLLVFKPSILRAVSAAGVAVIVVAILSATTLVPALLVLSGRRLIKPGLIGRVPGLRGLIRRTGDVTSEEGVFSRLAGWVQRRPWLVMIGTLGVLAVLALPLGHLQLRNSSVELLPRGSDQSEYLQTIADQYPASESATAWVVAEAPLEDVTDWSSEVAALPEIASVDPPQAIGGYVVLPVRVDTDDPGGPDAVDAVRALRALDAPFPTWVTGQAATQIDFLDALLDRVWWAVAIVVVATLVLLFLMTRSLVIPVKALLTNVLSLSASLGVLVWAFQDGHLQDLLGFTSTGGIETYVLAMVVAFAFGLAMDYEVFLLSRIKEAWDKGAGNDEAVRRGLQRSGRIITSAAVIIVVVFTGFVFGKLLIIKEVGFSLAVAVIIDATLVRMLLVPATMTVLGRANWWAPAWLLRATRRIAIEH